MTVAELIEELLKYPQHYAAVIEADLSPGYSPKSNIRKDFARSVTYKSKHGDPGSPAVIISTELP